MRLNWKWIGLAATVGGGLLTLLNSLAEEKKMEETIEEKVNEAFALREVNNEEESE